MQKVRHDFFVFSKQRIRTGFFLTFVSGVKKSDIEVNGYLMSVIVRSDSYLEWHS